MSENTKDRREEILNEELSKWVNIKAVQNIYPKKFPAAYSTIAKNAMDVHWTERALELLKYMAENNIECVRDFELSERVIGYAFKFKGEFISKEQLFENFL